MLGPAAVQRAGDASCFSLLDWADAVSPFGLEATLSANGDGTSILPFVVFLLATRCDSVQMCWSWRLDVVPQSMKQ